MKLFILFFLALVFVVIIPKVHTAQKKEDIQMVALQPASPQLTLIIRSAVPWDNWHHACRTTLKNTMLPSERYRDGDEIHYPTLLI